VTIVGVLLSLPALLLHQAIDYLREGVSESVVLPTWVWIAVAALFLFFITRLHETAVHYVDWFFSRSVTKAGERLGDAVLKARDYSEIETQLVQGVHNALGLASAGVFREQDSLFQRTASDRAWDDATRTIDPNDPVLRPAHAHRPYELDAKAAAGHHFPSGLMRPILAVPVGDQLRCIGVVLYGPHATGNALSHEERSMLADLADKAASVFMKLNDDQLRGRIAALESELSEIAAELAGDGPDSAIPIRTGTQSEG
jgi:hypothetical protein